MNTFTTFYGKGLDCIPRKPLAVIKHDFIKSLAYFSHPFPLHSILAMCRMVLQTKNHICQLSKIHSQSPTLPYRSPELLDRKAGSLDQLPTKKIQAKYLPKFQNHLASYACITVSGLIFLRDAHCSL